MDWTTRDFPKSVWLLKTKAKGKKDLKFNAFDNMCISKKPFKPFEK